MPISATNCGSGRAGPPGPKRPHNNRGDDGNPNYGGSMHEDSYQKMQKMNQINSNPSMMNEEMNMMRDYSNDPMKGILEIMQNLSYTNPNQVNAQLFQGM